MSEVEIRCPFCGIAKRSTYSLSSWETHKNKCYLIHKDGSPGENAREALASQSIDELKQAAASVSFVSDQGLLDEIIKLVRKDPQKYGFDVPVGSEIASVEMRVNYYVDEEESGSVPTDRPGPESLKTQQGGSHYKGMKIEPVTIIHENNLDFFQGTVLRYIMRHKLKGGAVDVKKAIHFCQMICEFQYGIITEVIYKEPQNERSELSGGGGAQCGGSDGAGERSAE